MEDQQQKDKKQNNTVLYVLYAAAAFFGLQLFLKSGRVQAATINPDRAAGPPPPTYAPMEPEPVIPVQAPPVKSAPKATAATEQFPLRKGMRGAMVRAIQQKLGVSADGIFGPATEAALKRRYGIGVVSELLFRSMTQASKGATVEQLIKQAVTVKKVAASAVVLKEGSRGNDVQRLQRWLGFTGKDADGIFGKRTQAALVKKTGKSSINLDQLHILLQTGMAGEVLVARQAATILDQNLVPYDQVKAGTMLGIKLMDLTDPKDQREYTQFQTATGQRRWIAKVAV